LYEMQLIYNKPIGIRAIRMQPEDTTRKKLNLISL
jgi:hypothetical protein